MNQANHGINGVQNVQDMLAGLFSPETGITGYMVEGGFCNHCGSPHPTMGCQVQRDIRMMKGPSVFVLQLKRWIFFDKHSTKNNALVSIPSSIAIPGAFDLNYELFGTVTHHGQVERGHYTANVQRQQQGDNPLWRWTHFDDAAVGKPLDGEPPLQSDAYMAFYAISRTLAPAKERAHQANQTVMILHIANGSNCNSIKVVRQDLVDQQGYGFWQGDQASPEIASFSREHGIDKFPALAMVDLANGDVMKLEHNWNASPESFSEFLANKKRKTNAE